MDEKRTETDGTPVGQPLHVFELGPDYIVACCIADAWDVWTETTGESDRGYREDLAPVPDDRPLRVWSLPDGTIAEEGEDEAAPVERTCGEWAAREGRGFLCSSEF